MYQTISEKIEVAGVYKTGRFFPKKFLWRRKEYCIESITFTTDIKDGENKQRMYSVLAKGTLYRLMFHRDTEIWTLAEVWYE